MLGYFFYLNFLFGGEIMEERKTQKATFNRRNFIKGMSAMTVLASMPLTISCKPEVIHDFNNQLSDDEMTSLTAILNHLFPATKNAPGASEINAANYFTWVLTDVEKDPEERTIMKDGIGWVNEIAIENFNKRFEILDKEEKEKTLRLMAEESWGESWISVTITQIFEALLSDPIYGSNTNQMGWKWLEHTTGAPQPTNKNNYPTLLEL